MDDILTRFKSLIKEADELADAFSVTGEDDNSYDAGSVRDDAEEKMIAYVALSLHSMDAEVWLSAAKKRLDSIA